MGLIVGFHNKTLIFFLPATIPHFEKKEKNYDFQDWNSGREDSFKGNKPFVLF